MKDYLKIAKKYNITISLGDGLRPGAGCDAAQWEESMVLGSTCISIY